jgi:hypothetical protein
MSAEPNPSDWRETNELCGEFAALENLRCVLVSAEATYSYHVAYAAVEYEAFGADYDAGIDAVTDYYVALHTYNKARHEYIDIARVFAGADD